jgi:hypothetical protein
MEGAALMIMTPLRSGWHENALKDLMQMLL